MFNRLTMAMRVLFGGKTNPVGHAIENYHSDQGIAPPEGYDELATQGYILCSVARNAANKFADTAGGIPLKLQRHGKGGKWEDLDSSEDDEHPLMQLLARPNPQQTQKDFISALMKYRRIAGESPVVQFGPSESSPPLELWALRPDRVFCQTADDGSIRAYVYRNNGKSIPFDMTGEYKQLMMWKTFNPLSEYRGLPPLSAAAMEVSAHNEATRYNARMLKNGMRPTGALKFKGENGKSLTPAARKQLEADIDRKLIGSNNAGRPLILDNLEWQDLTISAKDMDWIEGRRDAARTISFTMGCPPILLGIPGDATYSNLEEGRLGLYLDNVLPELQDLVDWLNVWLVPRYGKGLRLVIDRKRIDALAPYFAKQAAEIDKLQHLTLDEKREMNGYPAFDTPGTTVLLVSSSLIPVDMAAEPPEPAPDETAPVDEDGVPVDPPKPGAKPGKPKPPTPAKAVSGLLGQLHSDLKSIADRL
jgi:HK97 family phage portal protein